MTLDETIQGLSEQACDAVLDYISVDIDVVMKLVRDVRELKNEAAAWRALFDESAGEAARLRALLEGDVDEVGPDVRVTSPGTRERETAGDTVLPSGPTDPVDIGPTVDRWIEAVRRYCDQTERAGGMRGGDERTWTS